MRSRLQAVEIEGLAWSKVALHVPGRNQLQCRERWYKKANPDRKTTKFAEQEDAALRDLVPKHPKGTAGETDWPAVAGKLPGRTSQDCKRRWDQLVCVSVPSLKCAQSAPTCHFHTKHLDSHVLGLRVVPCLVRYCHFPVVGLMQAASGHWHAAD